MNKITIYFKESYKELLEKVSWPNWNQLQQSTIITLIATILITFVIWSIDVIGSKLLSVIYSLFK